jgi:predicted deacylase
MTNLTDTARLTVAGIEVDAGERVTHLAQVHAGERTLSVPVIVVNGANDGPRVAITAGIHGSEYVSIEAARRVGMTVDPRELRGSLIVAPIANPASFQARTIYTSGLDGDNLNRVFPGDPNGSPSQMLAAWLFETIIRPAQFYIDLHGGDMIEALVPFVLAPRCPDPAVEEASHALAVASGIERIIHGEVAGSTCSTAAAAGITSILAEVGGQGVWDEEHVTELTTAVLRALRHLGALPGETPPIPGQRAYETFAWMRATEDGLFHPHVTVGEMVRQGQPLGAVLDYFGNTLQPVEAVADGEVMFLVTSLAITAGDPLLAIGA